MCARYNPRKEHSLKRSYGFRMPKKSFLIVCEGENTEPEYFNAFRLTTATVKAVGKGLGTMSLVKEALAIRRDFNLYRGTLQRSRYGEKLSKYLGESYSKRAGYAAKLYQRIKSLEPIAIQNAETLQAEMAGIKPSDAESSTTVHELVKSLNKYAD